MLMNYPWPGNVRELENVIGRAVILSEDDTIHGYNLPPSVQNAGMGASAERESRIEAAEFEYIVEALKTTHGNITHAAKDLGMTRRMLGLRIAKYKIDYHVFHRGLSQPAI